MRELLLKYGFKVGKLKNEFTKGSLYTAIIWKGDEKLSLTEYTPNIKRYLGCETFDNEFLLEKRLKNIC